MGKEKLYFLRYGRFAPRIARLHTSGGFSWWWSKRSSYVLRKKIHVISILGIRTTPGTRHRSEFPKLRVIGQNEKMSELWKHNTGIPALSRNVCVWYRSIIHQVTLPSQRGNSTSRWVEALFRYTKTDRCYFIYIRVNELSCIISYAYKEKTLYFTSYKSFFFQEIKTKNRNF